MTGEIYDYPTRILVHSESDGDSSYLVDLCAYPVKPDGAPVVFNGSCQCKGFYYNCEPNLKTPNNNKVCRCKHIRWARENCLDFILPKMREMDPNIDEIHQT